MRLSEKIINVQNLLDASINFDILYNIVKSHSSSKVQLVENSEQISGLNKVIDVYVPTSDENNLVLFDTSTKCYNLYNANDTNLSNAIVNGYIDSNNNLICGLRFIDNDSRKTYYFINNSDYNSNYTSGTKYILPLFYTAASSIDFTFNDRVKIDTSCNYIISLYNGFSNSYIYTYDSSNNLVSKNKISTYKNWYDETKQTYITDSSYQLYLGYGYYESGSDFYESCIVKDPSAKILPTTTQTKGENGVKNIYIYYPGAYASNANVKSTNYSGVTSSVSSSNIMYIKAPSGVRNVSLYISTRFSEGDEWSIRNTDVSTIIQDIDNNGLFPINIRAYAGSEKTRYYKIVYPTNSTLKYANVYEYDNYGQYITFKKVTIYDPLYAANAIGLYDE